MTKEQELHLAMCKAYVDSRLQQAFETFRAPSACANDFTSLVEAMLIHQQFSRMTREQRENLADGFINTTVGQIPNLIVQCSGHFASLKELMKQVLA